MVFTGICLFGILFVVVSLPFALRYEARRRKQGAGGNFPVAQPIPSSSDSAWWAKDASYTYTRTSSEYIDALARHHSDPGHFPAPLPPSTLRSHRENAD
jgi:hypothetical protein